MNAEEIHISAWKNEFRTCILERGALNISLPRDFDSLAEEVSQQRKALETVFAPLIAGAEVAMIFGLAGDVYSEALVSGIPSFLVNRGDVWELSRNPSVIVEHSDFLIDRFRVNAKLGHCSSAYPSYSDLICIFADPSAMALDWIKKMEGISLWRLGCLKTPKKRISPPARLFIGSATRKGQLAVGIEMGHAGTGVTLYIPSDARGQLVERVLALELPT